MLDAPTHPSEPDRGQALPLLLVVLALAMGASMLIVEVVLAAGEDDRAQAAADAAALAGAAAGRDAAGALASANDSRLVAYGEAGDVVEVTVVHGRATARATAEAVGRPATGPDRGDRDGLAPAMHAALARAEALLARSIPVSSGYRSRTEQEDLWNRRAQNPYPVAPPGTSLHEVGLAIDIPSELVPTLLTVAAEAGLCQPLPQDDPVHFEPCPPTRR